MNGSWFRLFIFSKNLQIEPNLNSAFANKYDKIWCWPRYFDNFREISNSSISLLRTFIYNQEIQKNYLLFGFPFRLLQKSSKLPLIFLRFQSILSVKWMVKSTIHCYIINGTKTFRIMTLSIMTLSVIAKLKYYDFCWAFFRKLTSKLCTFLIKINRLRQCGDFVSMRHLP